MSRTFLSAKRQKDTINTNIGRIIIFCEGMTEKYYLEYFTNIIKKNKFNDIKIEIESADGNASRVFHFAEGYLKNEENNRKYSNYKKYLIFDCDAPPNIQRIITQMAGSDYKFELLISNYLFEVWLLMHFENVKNKMSKKKIYSRLAEHLTGNYEKASPGIIREIIQNGSIEEAIKNAEELAKKYKNEEKDITINMGNMNPYTNVNILIEQLLAEIT